MSYLLSALVLRGALSESATVVVIDVQSGALIAQAGPDPWVEHPMGGTLDPFVLASALEAHTLTLATLRSELLPEPAGWVWVPSNYTPSLELPAWRLLSHETAVKLEVVRRSRA